MRLILKEYISSLKEKDELDLLLSELFVQQGYIADSLPKTGNRQYGVDLQMHNDKELLLFVIKQGNISRKIWNDGENSVRQSLDEIHDVAIKMLTPDERSKRIRIIVASNGYKDEAIKNNWNGYVSENTEWDNTPINIEFLGIDDIVQSIQDNFFNEYIFIPEMRSSLRKALYFIDGTSDYHVQYYEYIIDTLLLSMRENHNNKKKEKTWLTLYMASQMIAQYAAEANNLTISIRVTEYVIIQLWSYMKECNLFEDPLTVMWLLNILEKYEHWNDLYVEKIKQLVDGTAQIPLYNVVEMRVILYEIFGYLATYVNYLLKRDNNKAKEFLGIIVEMINQYPSYAYAPYDNSIAVIIMILKLFTHYQRREELLSIITEQLYKLLAQFRRNNKYPAPSDTFEEALDIEYGVPDSDYETSAFWGYYLLLIVVFHCDEIYNEFKDFFCNDLKNVCKCVWFIRQVEENKLYKNGAMVSAGEGIAIKAEKTYELLEEEVKFIFSQYENEVLSFDEYSFPELEFIICRYYSYIPRVNTIE